MEQPPRGWSKAARRRRAARPAPADAARCNQCGQGTARHQRTDAAGVHGRVCDGCQWATRDELSFG